MAQLSTVCRGGTDSRRGADRLLRAPSGGSRSSPSVWRWPLGDKRHWPRRVAQAPAGFRRLASVPVVFFPLVANRAHDDVVADDLEENDVARAAEWNDQFARATIAQFCSTA